jgi:ABC-2 type transport system permease protein/oleandomycin transport system permease protein
VTTITSAATEPIRAERLAHDSAVRDTLVISRRNLRRIARTPQLLAFSSLLPVVFTLLFYYVFGGAVHTAGHYIDYLVPTMLILSTLFGATTAIAMTIDVKEGMIERFRSLPISRSAVLGGRTLADLARAVLVTLLVLVVGTIMGFRFHNGVLPALGALTIVLAFTFAMSWEMAWLGMRVKDPETAQVAGFLPIFLLVFASSGFVPIDTMPGWLQPVARNQPLTVTINAVRALTQGGPVYHWLWQTVVWTIGIVVLFGSLALVAYRKL